MEIPDSIEPIEFYSFDPEEASDYQTNYLSPLNEIEDIQSFINFVDQSDEERFAQYVEILSEATVDSSASEMISRLDQVITFLIDHLDPTLYSEQIQELQKLLKASPFLRSIQVKTGLYKIIAFILEQIKSVSPAELEDWLPEYDEFEKPEEFVHLIRLALLYQRIDMALKDPVNESLLEEMIAELLVYEDFNKALKTANRIKNTQYRNKILDRISSSLARPENIKRAHNYLKDIDLTNQLYLSQKMTEELCEGAFFDEAKEFIEKLNKKGLNTDKLSHNLAKALLEKS